MGWAFILINNNNNNNKKIRQNKIKNQATIYWKLINLLNNHPPSSYINIFRISTSMVWPTAEKCYMLPCKDNLASENFTRPCALSLQISKVNTRTEISMRYKFAGQIKVAFYRHPNKHDIESCCKNNNFLVSAYWKIQI